MPNLPPKTQVSTGSCGGCGRPVGIILNKNGNGYYMCGWSSDAGQPCGHHERWGKVCSQQFQRDFLETRKTNNDASNPPAAASGGHVTTSNEPANDNTEPTPAPSDTPPNPTGDADGPKQPEPEPTGRRGRAFGRRRST